MDFWIAHPYAGNMANAFLERLASGLLLADGAMGTELYADGIPFERNFDELNSVVIAQGRTIARLQKQLETLGETLRGQDLDRIQPHNQKPPHYAP